jgi:hypothetical protein
MFFLEKLLKKKSFKIIPSKLGYFEAFLFVVTTMEILLCNILASVNLILMTKILINVVPKAIIYKLNNYKYLHKITFYNTDLCVFCIIKF